MSLLKFAAQDPESRVGKKSLKVVIAFGAIAGVFAIRSTLAADISLNLGAPVEFGQGVVQTTACDTNGITVTPFSTFVNAPGAGSHKFTSLKISGINSSPGKCAGKTFLIKAYGDSGLLSLFDYTETGPNMRPASPSYDFVEITNNNGVFSWTSDGTDGDNVTNDADVNDINRDLTETSFVLSFASEKIESTTITRTPLALSEDVKRITVETYDANLLSDRVLSASQVGLVSPSGFGSEPSEACITQEDCLPYITLKDYLDDLTQEDVDNYNGELAPMVLTKAQIIDAFSVKFTYDPSAEGQLPWTFQINFLGTNFLPLYASLLGTNPDFPLSIPGNVIGFDGNVGLFVPEGGPIAVAFSLNNAVQNNLGFDLVSFYSDTPERTVPVRNLINIWTFSQLPYSE